MPKPHRPKSTHVSIFSQPDDLVKDPRYAVPVSRFGQDRGAIDRPVKQAEIGTGRDKVVANVVKDGLDRMKDEGGLSQMGYDALRMFQKEFDRCGYAHYVTVNMSGGGRGDVSVEDIFARAQASRDYVHHVFKLLGGQDTLMAKMAFWYLGIGQSFRDIAEKNGKTNHFWSGVFHSMVNLMEEDYRLMCKGKRRSLRPSGVRADDNGTPI